MPERFDEDDAQSAAAPQARLKRILEKIAEVAGRSAADQSDLTQTVQEARELADLMRELYGPEALAVARRLEGHAVKRSFSGLVRLTVEYLEREEQR